MSDRDSETSGWCDIGDNWRFVECSEKLSFQSCIDRLSQGYCAAVLAGRQVSVKSKC